MENYGIYHESVLRAQDCVKTALHYCRVQGSSSLTFGHLLKGIIKKSPFLASQLRIALEISDSELSKALEDVTSPEKDVVIEEEQITYTDQVRDFLEAAQNNTKWNGRQWFDEMDFFFSFFLVKPNPLYQFLDQHNISYKRIFEKKR